MKQILAVGVILLLTSLGAIAAPGDTTWVQAHSTIQMDHHGNFDTTIEFPDGSTTYRKVIMTFTLGKYQCPGNPQYCGDWDYTISLFVRPTHGDTMELGRFITPYANATYDRTPWSYKQRYEFDVTDFYNELRDTATIRIVYSGYSWGFTGDIKFAMIEGTPPRNVIKVQNAWNTSSRFGDTSASAAKIEERVDTVSMEAPTGTVSTDLRMIISGHGNDDNGCSEFCKKFYEVELNGNKFDKTELWRADCGRNHIYPQSGTWVYDRGNWCPGDVVFPNIHLLAGITAGSKFELDVDFENYIGSKNLANRSWGSYTVRGNVFYYGGFNKTVDAELENVVAPNNHETFFRYNPANGSPIVILRNTGSTTLTSVKFRYQVNGAGNAKEYTWNGSLASLDTAWVEFPLMEELRLVVGATNKFDVEIIEVNGSSSDVDATNNKFSTTFEAPQIVTNEVVILTKTNAGLIGGVSETSWKLIELISNKTIAERNNMSGNTQYFDTLTLESGMYRLIVEDRGCQGLRWWANPNDGNGYISIRPKGANTGIPLVGYFAGDFGCGFTENFNVLWNTSVKNINDNEFGMSVYPNPASSNITAYVSTVNNVVDGKIKITDMAGRVVIIQNASHTQTTIDVSSLTNGMYFVSYTDNNTANTTQLKKVVIAR